MTLKYRKKPDPAKCDVSRCRKDPFEDHVFPNGPAIRYCREHGHEAAKAHFSESFEVRPVQTEQALTVRGKDLGTGELVTPELIAKVQAERQAADAELVELRQIVLETDEDAVFGESELARVRAAAKAWDRERTKITAPLQQATDGVNGLFMPAIKSLKALGETWSRALGQYRAKVENERRAQLQAAEEAARAAQAIQATPPAQDAQEAAQAAAEVQALQAVAHEAVMAAAASQPAGEATYIDRYRWEVMDLAALPREYLCPDKAKLDAAVKAAGEATAIPGLRVWNDPIVRPK